jgi:hypothetical protein
VHRSDFDEIKAMFGQNLAAIVGRAAIQQIEGTKAEALISPRERCEPAAAIARGDNDTICA